jgi:hypothetical protein
LQARTHKQPVLDVGAGATIRQFVGERFALVLRLHAAYSSLHFLDRRVELWIAPAV